MKATIITAVVCIVFLFAYVISVNYISSVDVVQAPGSSSDIKQETGATDIQLGFSESVSVSTTRTRWYGVFETQHGANETVSYLYVFNQVKLPWETEGFSWVYVHSIFMFLVTFIFVAVLLYDMTKTNERGQTTQHA